ncbi:MAG: adenylyl-sulfate kinase [Gammaproteobacteria bacterium]|nr:adenylyl-sulfate kinase [Gammaproteobacteria bacterium]
MQRNISQNPQVMESIVSEQQRAKQKRQNPAVIWLTGISGAGKSTLAFAVDRYLTDNEFHSFVLDGDDLRLGLSSDLGFSEAARHENIRRVGEVSKLFCQSGLLTLVSLISPFRADRQTVRNLVGSNFVEIYIKAPLEVCEQRDTKGFYKKVRDGKLSDFTGIDSIYEEPLNPELMVETDKESVEASTQRIIDYLKSRGLLRHQD